MNDDLTNRQIQREKESQNAGYKKFIKNEEKNKRFNNGSATTFGVMVKKYLLQQVIENLEKKLKETVGQNKTEIADALQRLIGANSDGSTHTLFDEKEAAFLGIQLALVTALNPNILPHKEAGRAGGDKKLLVKKTVNELQAQIGNVIHKQMQLKIIKETFPVFFRNANKWARQPFKDGAYSSTAYWEDNLFRSIRRYSDKLREEGDHKGADIIDNRKIWTRKEEATIGSLVLSCVLNACHLYLKLQVGSRNGKKSTEIILTPEGKLKQQEIMDYASEYTHDLLPMLIEPIPITNENLGGWLCNSLQDKEHSHNGNIFMSDKHLEFINRQARTRFQINPFTQSLMEELCERQWKLGKFHYQMMEDPISINAELGYAHLDKEKQDIAVRNDPRTKGLRRRNTAIFARNTKKVKDGLIAYAIQAKAKLLIDDEAFYIPMKYDFRGRIYSRVPFISFQSNDSGRYLIRFADATKVDDRTEHWFKVGISNAGGNDKLCWDKRIQWFDKYREEIINVGRMVGDGDFRRAYEFLNQDHIDDPFCLAALANEYVKVFVDKTQDYTQTFVCMDASCSGTSIFNAWRQNLNGAKMTNLVDTDKPADIYMEVWKEIKRIAPEGTFRTRHIKRLEDTKLIRKMMKTTYVPAQYASPENEQKNNLRNFNNKLKQMKLDFTDVELKVLQDLWVIALDEVSSIKTVVEWFKDRTREALVDNKEIYYTTSNGSRMTLSYPKSELKRIYTFGYGGTKYKRERVAKPTEEVDTRRLLNSVTANVTHATDAAALCEALWNWDATPFVAIHDACGIPPSRHLDDAVMRLKEGFVTSTQHDVWKTFRTDNNLSDTPLTQGPVVGDLTDWSLVTRSKYLYS